MLHNHRDLSPKTREKVEGENATRLSSDLHSHSKDIYTNTQKLNLEKKTQQAAETYLNFGGARTFIFLLPFTA